MVVVIRYAGTVVELSDEEAKRLVDLGVAYCPSCEGECGPTKLCDQIATKGGGDD